MNYYTLDQFNQYCISTAIAYGGLQANIDQFSLNDQYDAYRHALMSAKLTEEFGASIAKTLGDTYEFVTQNPAAENNMDRFNNNVGREEYQKWKDATDKGQTIDSLEKWIYDKVKNGQTINDLSDPRRWVEPETVWDQVCKVVGPWKKVVIPGGDLVDGDPSDPNEAAEGEFISPPRTYYVPPTDPLVLDITGAGIQTVGLSAGIQFDQNGKTKGTGVDLFLMN